MKYVAVILLAACGSVSPPVPVKPTPVAVRRPGNVRGRIELDGRPVTSFGITYATSFASWAGWSSPIEIHTKDGTFTAAIPSGHWDLIVVARGAARHVIAGVDVGTSLDLGTISLRHGHTLSGVVRDEAGTPVAGARVEFTARPMFDEVDDLTSLTRGNIATHTDADGRYTIHGAANELLGPAKASLSASSDSRASLPVDAPDADASVDLRVIPTGTLVVSASGAGAWMALASANGTGLVGRHVDDSWRFDRIPAGTYEIRLVDSRFQPRAQQAVTVQEGDVESVTLTVTALSPVIVDVVAKTCSEIQVRDLDNAEVAVAPCANAMATFPALEPGSYQACVDKHECRLFKIDSSATRQRVDLTR